MAKTKTTVTGKSVTQFLNSVKNKKMREDSFKLLDILESHTGLQPQMWGPSIIGYGKYHYKYESGHEGDAPLAGFSPRAAALTVYVADFKGRSELLKKLGKYTSSKACIYIKKLEDIDIAVLKKVIDGSMKAVKKMYPS